MIPKPFPSPATVWRAIDIYLKHAYDGPPPLAVRDRLEALRHQPAERFYDCAVLEHDSHAPPIPCSLRLGNRNYPHMKLSVQSSGADCFFKADTHDRHCCPATGSPDYQPYRAMVQSNEALASQIETDWAAAGIPTFREFLRQDLARRQAAARSPGNP